MGIRANERDNAPQPGNQRSKAPRRGPSRLLLFARGFCKHPKLVGWCLPSSRFLVEQVLKQIDWDQARVIVEYGPGVGAFTVPVLQRMRADARLIAMEINPEFFSFLSNSVRDPRLHLVQESAADVDAVLERLGIGGADYIISGIPFRTLAPPLRDTIVRKTYSALRPQGSFLVYQFSDTVRPYLERVFSQVSREIELLNLLPARLFFCAR